MSERTIRGESSSTAHKRQAVAPQDEEGPLIPSSSASESLAQQGSSLSIPKIPPHLIADLILPFVADRSTWNSLCSASKELRRAGKKMTPPWPNKAFNLGIKPVRQIAFSPSGSQLAFCMNNRTGQDVVHVWDRWGKETLLEGHTECTSVYCLKYSLDGEYLASGSGDGSIRIWHAELLHTTLSKPYMERPTQTPKEADTILLGCRLSTTALSFSQTDSNILASGGLNGEFKVWNVKEQACIHSFNPGRGQIRSLFFAGGVESACIALTHTMSIIQLWRAEGSSNFARETIREADIGGSGLIPGAAFSPSGSFVAATFFPRTWNGNESTLALFDLETMTKTQPVVMPGFTATCVAVSPDSKELVVVGSRGRIRLLQTDDFSIQRDLDTTGEAKKIWSVAFDPTCRVLAIGCREGSLELRRL
jgi:WD40 repeat protein